MSSLRTQGPIRRVSYFGRRRSTTFARPFAGTTSKSEGAGPPNRRASSRLPKAHAECAPVAAADADRRGEVLHQHEIAAAHVAPVGLQQERFGIRRHLFHRAIVE